MQEPDERDAQDEEGTHYHGEERDDNDDDSGGELSPLLPIFSAEHLGQFYIKQRQSALRLI